MFLRLAHAHLEVFPVAKNLVKAIYLLTESFPVREKYGLSTQMQRASVSFLLNIAEGSARRSATERIRFYEIARASLVELDAALEIAHELSYFQTKDHPELEFLVIESFKKISLLIKSTADIR